MPIDEENRAEQTSIGQAIRRGWPIIAVLGLAALAAGMFMTSRRDATYEATAQLLVSPLSQHETSLYGTDLIRDGGDTSQTAGTVAALIDSPEAAAETARRLGGGWTPADVRAAVEIEPVNDTQVLSVKAEASDPEVAAAVATEFGRSAVRLRREQVVPQLEERLKLLTDRRSEAPQDDYSQRDRLFGDIRLLEDTLANGGDPTLRFAEAAATPTSASTTSPLVIGFIALLGGLALGLVTAIVVDRLRRGVRTEEELLSAHALPVLARLPKTRSNRSAPDLLPAGAQNEIRALAVQLEQLGRFDQRVVVVTSASGGDGRTTVATNLAVALATIGHSTMVVDLDDSSQHIGARLVVAGQIEDLRLERPSPSHTTVRARLEAAKDAVDWVVVDAPAVLDGAEALQAAGEADDVLIVARLDHTNRAEYGRAVAMLERAGAQLTGIVVMGAGPRRRRSPRIAVDRPAPSRGQMAPVEETEPASDRSTARR